MPVIARFGKAKMLMYFADHNPPHVHIVEAGVWATVAISDGRVLTGAVEAKLLKQVRTFVAGNAATLMKLWDEYQREG